MQAKSKTIVFIVLTFLIGGVAGGFVGATYFGGKDQGRHGRGDILKEFTERVRLKGEQPAVIDSIVEAYRSRMGEVRKSYFEMFRQQRDSLRRSIRSVLSEEQQPLYDEYVKEIDERERRYRREREKK